MINRYALVAACAIDTTQATGCGRPTVPRNAPGTSQPPSVVSDPAEDA